MIQVENGKVVKTELPKIGRLSDGRVVSGYHRLPIATLKAEGWLTEEEVKPKFDAAKETLVFDKHTILQDKVQVVYKAEAIPEPVPSETEKLREDFTAMKEALIGKDVIKEADLVAEETIKK